MNNAWTARHSAWLALLLAAAVVRCGSDTLHYSAAQDDEAIAAVERRWSGTVGTGSLSILLCEDRAANDADPEDSCQVEHVVKGGGRTVASQSEEPGGVGCGGCPFMVRTRVTAVAILPSGEVRKLRGIVAFGSAYDGDPYQGDWAFQLDSEDAGPTPLSFEGRIQSDGSMSLWGQLLQAAGLSEGSDDAVLTNSVEGSCVRGS